MRSEFLFEFLGGVGPVDRFCRLVVIGNVLTERGFQGSGTDKMIGLQMFALQETEPDFDLIQPGRIGRQPVHLEVQSPVTRAFLLINIRRSKPLHVRGTSHGASRGDWKRREPWSFTTGQPSSTLS
jgi:hypothetical protein